MMGLEDIKKINQDPETYAKGKETDGQRRSDSQTKRDIRLNRRTNKEGLRIPRQSVHD